MAKRRANGEGSIRRRRNGRWEVQIMDGYKPDGRRNMRSFSGKTQKEAKEKRDRTAVVCLSERLSKVLEKAKDQPFGWSWWR